MGQAADRDGPDDAAQGSGADRSAGGAGRTTTETAVLDALVEREGDGMTVFELRTWVDADIDELEETLSDLDREGCIDVDTSGDRTRIHPTEVAVSAREDRPDRSLLDRVREWVGL